LIVDEPTAGLDPEERVRFRNLLCEIAGDRIVLLSTHIVEDIEKTCEKIAVLKRGELFYNGTLKDFIGDEKCLEDAYMKKMEGAE
jgi:ABC-2 type transport system ATP-binding protein